MLRAVAERETAPLRLLAEREVTMLRVVQDEREVALQALAEREAETSARREALAADHAARGRSTQRSTRWRPRRGARSRACCSAW